MTSPAPPMQQHSVATEPTSVCQMVYATCKGSEDLCSLAQVVQTEAGTRAAHGPTAVSARAQVQAEIPKQSIG
jgi:hypothetical protein